MKKLIVGLLLFVVLLPVSISQIIITAPALPIDNQAVTITFDASQGNAGLKGFTGDVYAHAGVITDKSTSGGDWKYVIAGWSENTAKAKLISKGNNIYELQITPSIREFYGVPATEKILKLAFVFRNGDGSKTGKTSTSGDIFVDVFAAGLNVSITNPSTEPYITTTDKTIQFAASANQADSIFLFTDNTLINKVAGNALNYTITNLLKGKHWIKAVATKGNEKATDSIYYFGLDAIEEAKRPAGTKDGITFIDNKTVTFCLYAPYKNNVFVIGDFNNWELADEYLMKKDGSRFWLTVSNLDPKKEYLFQYLVDGSLRIADPYCEKVSDPWNDKWITATTYPNLVPYPDGKTSEIAGSFQIEKPTYNWQTTKFTPPDQSNLIIYELHIRDFVATGAIKTITDTIAYFKRLGINAIELMPINEFEGNDSWGYNPSFYFATDKAYGTINDYKTFIDKCHENGIAVIIDMVFNHSFGQSPLLRLYAENYVPTAQNPWYNIACPHPPYCWGADFNHESPLVEQFIDSVTTYCLTEYKVDGFRFDFTKGLTNKQSDGWAYDAGRIQNIKRMSNHIRSVNPAAYIILEHFTDNNEEKELANDGMMIWGNMTGKYGEAVMGWNDANKSDFTAASYKSRGWTKPNLIAYMESHDEERLMFKTLTNGNSSGSYNCKSRATALRRVELAAAFFIPIPGPKMIWQFGEIGYDESIETNGRVGRKPIKWEYYNGVNQYRLYTVYSALNNLKRNHEAFSTQDFTMDVTAKTKRIFLKHTTMDIVILGNFDVVANAIAPSFTKTGKWYDYFSGDSIQVTDVESKINFAPGEYRIYTSKRLQKPAVAASIEKMQLSSFRVYPNPASSKIIIEFKDVQPDYFTITDISGRQLKAVNVVNSTHELDVTSFPDGIYFIAFYGKNGLMGTKKIMKN